MAQADYWAGDSVTSVATGGTTSATLTLVGAGVNTCQRITDIMVYMLGTVTAYSVYVYKNDASTVIASFGGQLGGAAVPPVPMVINCTTPINCSINDNAKIVVGATGASKCEVTANYTFGTK